ncbi:MAG: DUF1905 domain-containing protein [Candidatus Doudnabacteria bacterium]
MTSPTYKFKSEIWEYPGKAAWYFVTLPTKLGQQIRNEFGDLAAGFGSLPVKVKLKQVEWDTSIFPDKKSSSYVLPLKAKVRKAAQVKVSDTINIEIKIKI